MHIRDKINTMVCKMHYIIARDFLNDLYSSGISYSVIKGCPLEFMKNGTVEGRIINDIDILVDRSQSHKVINLLQKHGFLLPDNIHRGEYIAAIANSHQYPVYFKCVENFYSQVDVNFDVFWGEYCGDRFSISSLLECTIDLNFWGCNIKTLPPMKHMIVVLLHHYKEMNSIYHLMGHRAIKPRMFEDIRKLIDNNPRIFNPEEVLRECQCYKILPYAYYMFYYANEFYGDHCLDLYVKALESPEGVPLLDKYGLSDVERKVWKIDFLDRLDNKKVFTSLSDELSKKDRDKLIYNRKIFGAKDED